MTTVFAQRQELRGTILNVLEAPEGGITIFNENTMDGTVTSYSGKFSLEVQPNDRIIIQALQYEPFTLLVTEETLKQEDLIIQLKEGVNVLDEVRITNSMLLVEVEEVPDVNHTLDNANNAIYSIPQVDRMENTFSDRVRQPEEYALRNVAMEQNMPRFNCLNIVGLLLAVVNEIVPLNFNLEYRKQAVIERFNEEMLQNNYSTKELVTFLDIKEEEMSRFLYFASESGLSNDLLRPERELDLLQHLSDQAKLYKERQAQQLLKPTEK
jgi:hypothetical protein